MKYLVIIVRWLVGLLFIFSGLVKANDPLGLSYKMQEFFEAWHWNFFDSFSLYMAFGMNLLEVLAGVAIIIGWKARFFSRLLLILIVFFTFLTSYVLFSGKIKACGCFGDCIPLTPIQTFTKDVLLLILIIFLVFTTKYVKPFFSSGAAFVTLIGVVLILAITQWYVLRHLPFVDCLPYKIGNNLLDEMKTPENAVPDVYTYTFQYQKDGKMIEFAEDSIPDDLDSSYVFVDRSAKLIKKGNGLTAAIADFALQTADGSDTTQALLQTKGRYILLFARDFSNVKKWEEVFQKIYQDAGSMHIPVFIVTADLAEGKRLFPNVNILQCDATVIKTAARVNPTYIIMQGPTVKNKISFADAQNVLAFLKQE
ncbi:MAG: DoxX family membrane protein [Sphingobacteriales bacterium]|uniref:BT_3928 family protein n=1 Tax=Hydrotalea flava TaxID=714549 RepID=UPI0008314E1A|nr:BT_3928 family protein [Hydrotalea flava]RTL56777.1 MAG: DoxX family membrane protein [Sphingobacteriales bacterium]